MNSALFNGFKRVLSSAPHACRRIPRHSLPPTSRLIARPVSTTTLINEVYINEEESVPFYRYKPPEPSIDAEDEFTPKELTADELESLLRTVERAHAPKRPPNPNKDPLYAVKHCLENQYFPLFFLEVNRYLENGGGITHELYALCLQACSLFTAGQMRHIAWNLVQEMKDMGFTPTQEDYDALLRSTVGCGDWPMREDVVAEIKRNYLVVRPDLLIVGYLKSGQFEQAVELAVQLKEEGNLDRELEFTILRTLCDVGEAETVYHLMVYKGFQYDESLDFKLFECAAKTYLLRISLLAMRCGKEDIDGHQGKRLPFKLLDAVMHAGARTNVPAMCEAVKFDLFRRRLLEPGHNEAIIISYLRSYDRNLDRKALTQALIHLRNSPEVTPYVIVEVGKRIAELLRRENPMHVRKYLRDTIVRERRWNRVFRAARILSGEFDFDLDEGDLFKTNKGYFIEVFAAIKAYIDWKRPYVRESHELQTKLKTLLRTATEAMLAADLTPNHGAYTYLIECTVELGDEGLGYAWQYFCRMREDGYTIPVGTGWRLRDRLREKGDERWLEVEKEIKKRFEGESIRAKGVDAQTGEKEKTLKPAFVERESRKVVMEIDEGPRFMGVQQPSVQTPTQSTEQPTEQQTEQQSKQGLPKFGMGGFMDDRF